jgi:DNA-directed RNA polymerase specialized sigma24 family protein
MSPSVPIPPLTRNGYTRTEKAQADIEEAWPLKGRDLAAAFDVDGGSPGHLCVEALVFFVRRELNSGDRRTAEALFSTLVIRAQRGLRTMIRGVDDDARQDMQSDVLADMTRLILADDDSGDFLQSRFWLYLRRRATTARVAWLRSKRTYVLDTERFDDGTPDDQIASSDLSPEDCAMVRDALDRLSPELRELVILRHYEGWRVGDEPTDRRDTADPTLAERYGITPRGVRKRLAKAEALLTKDQRDES